MLFVMIFATLALRASALCSTVCSEAFCDGKLDTHQCSARYVMVDPFLCEGGQRCFTSSCGQFGNQTDCEDSCEEWKDSKSLGSTDYPDCTDVCDDIPGDKAFLDDCNNQGKINAGEPDCYPRYPCSDEYCSGGVANTECTAVDIVVDPYGYLDSDDCKVLTCKLCGNHGNCKNKCELEKAENGDDDSDCPQLCQAVTGYKCFARD